MSMTKIASLIMSSIYDPYWPNVAFMQHGGVSGSSLSEDGNSSSITNSGAVAISGLVGQYGYFNGAGQYLSTPGDASLSYGVGDFTIEAWVFIPATPSNFRMSILAHGDTTGVGRWAFRAIQSDGSFGFSYSTGDASYVDLKTNLTVPIGSWAHCVVQRSNKVFQFFVNGVKATTVSGVGANNNTDVIGLTSSKLYTGHNSWDGVDLQYMLGSAKITKGVARYSANFTPSKTLPSAANDANWSNVSYFMDTANGFSDTSPVAHAISQVGTPILIDPSGQNGSLVYFPATGYTIAQAISAPGTGDFTFETRMCPTAVDAQYGKAIFDCRPTNTNGIYITLSILPSRKITLLVNNTNVVVGNTALTLGSMYHIALVRRSGVTTLYINGVADFTYTDTNNYLTGSPKVGYSAFTSQSTALNFVGFMNESRYTVGVARYAANFTPSVSMLPDARYRDYYWDSTLALLHLSSDTSEVLGNAVTVNGFAAMTNDFPLFGAKTLYLPGNSDISVANSGSMNLGSSWWTVECFVNPNAFGASPQVIMSQDNAAGNDGWQVSINANGAGLTVSFPGGASYSRTFAFQTNTWYHIAVCRYNSFFYVAINGVVTVSGSLTMRALTNAYPLRIGSSSNTSARNYFTGAISEVRLTKLARYLNSFSVPIFALPEKPNGDLYWQYDNGLFDFAGSLSSKSAVNIITGNSYVLNGNAALASTTKTGTQSVHFPNDGVSSMVNTTDNLFQFGTGDFTVEFWMRLDSSYGAGYLYALSNNGGSSQLTVRFGDSGYSQALQVIVGADPGNIYATGYAKANFANTWNHIAIVRRNGTLSVYMNGIWVAGGANTVNLASAAAYIGNASAGAYGLSGNIADLRTAKVARYIANFVPPAYSLPQAQAA